MKLIKDSIGSIQFFHREGFSDLKAFEEVIGRKAYNAYGLKIIPGERWMDCGGNVGAFALLAAHSGAKVTVYEPDPYNCDMIRRNLKLNNLTATIKQAALVHDDTKSTTLYIGNNNQVWRNSIITKWSDKGIKVPCLNFDDEAQNFDCCKMDIEGAEMPILENSKTIFKKLIYEWSFDVDPSLPRFRAVLDKHHLIYNVKGMRKAFDYEKRVERSWKKSWFPLCTTMHCFKK